MNNIDRLRLERGAHWLHRLGPTATAELLAEVASRIGGLPCILGSLAECEQRHKMRGHRSTANPTRSDREAGR